MQPIDLFGHNQYSLLGIQSILDLEKIPYNCVERIDPFSSHLLLASGLSLSLADIAAMEERRALVIGGGPFFARDVFGAEDTTVTNESCSIGLDQPLWPPEVAATARGFGKAELRIPLATICRLARVSTGTEKARLSLSSFDGSEMQPAVVQHRDFLWSLVDLGTAFANLLTESYLRRPVRRQSNGAPRLGLLASAVPQAAYYAAPDAVRRLAQQLCYTRLKRRVSACGEAASEYPIDATGWLLVELVKELIKVASGSLVSLAKWPAPYTSAACITHDVEPTRYAYTKGIRRLLDRITESHHPATVGLVAKDAVRHLNDGVLERLTNVEVICHGLEHRGEATWLGRGQTAAVVQIARAQLEHKLGRSIVGYRNPRLDRSEELLWSLDRVGFSYDSSYPDVDRENTEHFGGGVRVNFPYRPPVEDGSGHLTLSRCLELPVTAPDCIQPIFVGDTVAALREAVTTKAAFLRQTYGLYVAIVHAGVFGERDSATREAHLDFIKEKLGHPKVWLASLKQVSDWWRAREAVELRLKPAELELINHSSTTLCGLRVIFQSNGSETVLQVPDLKPDATLLLSSRSEQLQRQQI